MDWVKECGRFRIMPFPTTKTNPWKKGLGRGRKKCSHLWTESEWEELCKQAKADNQTFDADEYPISDACVAMITEFYERLERLRERRSA